MIKPGLVTDLVGLPLPMLVFVYHRDRSMAGGGPSSLLGRGNYPVEQRAASRG
jgi:hypothetical protein